MIIKEDYSYLTATDKKAIEQGFAALAVHSIRLDRYFTEEQQAQNRQTAERMTRDEWATHCDEIAREIGEQNEIALSALENAGLILGQYHNDPRRNDYDLWFWCNSNIDGRQLDYVTLSVNDRLSLEQQSKIVERATEILYEIDTVKNCAIIQYDAIYDKQKLAKFAEEFAEQNIGKFIKNGYLVGKIVRINPELNYGYKYGFKKKNTKTHGYRLSEKELYTISLENAA